MTKPHSCFNCHYIVDDCEYGDYGSILSTNFDCGKRGEEIPEDADFPFDVAPKECFRLDFWHSDFCLELVDGSQEEMNRAYGKYKEWCKKEYVSPKDGEFIKALGEAWKFIKGDVSFTGNELKIWSNAMDADLRRQVLQAIIQTAWCDYGGKDAKEEDNQ